MNNKIILAALGGLVVGLLLTLTVIPMTGLHSTMFGGRGAMHQGMGTVMDRHFIEQMIPHHEDAIVMAELALARSKRPEIKTLANAIIESQSKEIKDMQGWYKSWYGTEISKSTTNSGGMMHGGTMSAGGSNTDVALLENAADFDKKFIELMIPHHQMAVMMAQMLQGGTSRPEIEQLTQNIIRSQSSEIKKMQDWYSQWYK